MPCPSFDEVFEKVESGAVERGIVPVENSLGGSIHRNYDLFMRHQLHLMGEKIFRVRHCLIGFPGRQLSDITLVMSHPQALAQCEHHITRLGIQREVVYDTAGAVKMLKASGRRDHAAIASRRAAEVYEMQILQEGVEDDEANYTRFVVLAREPIVPQRSRQNVDRVHAEESARRAVQSVERLRPARSRSHQDRIAATGGSRRGTICFIWTSSAASRMRRRAARSIT